jgi:hypothetical protein
MIYLLISALLVLNIAYCFSPPIDGGKSAPMTSMDYIDIVELKGPFSGCTGTKVSATKILTAAHCIIDLENSQFTDFLKSGDFLFGVGQIISVSVHPKYKAAKLAQNIELYTLYDIAFISIEARPSQRKLPYPKIISKDQRPEKRGKVELAGYGSNQALWNGEKYDHQKTKYDLQIGDNKWSECPVDYFDSQINELSKLKDKIINNLSIQAQRIHTISEGNEVIESDGRAMVLSGDSGSPAIERDSNNNFIITGVASSILPFTDGSGSAVFEVEYNGKKLSGLNLEEMPENWGLRTKPDADFSEIQNYLKQNNLVDESGKMKDGVVIKRKYTRVTKGNFSDLSHPENQLFINSMLKK